MPVSNTLYLPFINKLIFLFNFYFLVLDSASLDVNFYWRQFNSTIPSDAVKGGTDVNGNATYIGTALFLPHGNLPGNIFINDKFVYGFAALSELKTDVNVKILCAPPNATQPIWKKINIDELEAASLNCVFVEGGNELGATLYIGRASVKGQYIIGKVFPKSFIYGGLDVWSKDERCPYRGLRDFEILTVCKNFTVTTS